MVPALVLSLTMVVSLLASPGVAITPAEGPDTFTTAEGCWQRLPLDRAELSQPLPVGALVPCPGVRPGARVWITNGGSTSGCTLNFVFRGTSHDEAGNPVDEGLFIGTAGHCIPGHDGEQTWVPGAAPVAMDAADNRFGEVVYAALVGASETNSKNLDFSLIRIDDAREPEVKPGLCHFGGPTGMSDTWSRGDVVHHFGQGLVYENTVQGRSGVVTLLEDEASALVFTGSALFGDSGSSLIEADGDALAVVVAILPPLVFSTPIAMQIERAEKELGIDFELVEAPLA